MCIRDSNPNAVINGVPAMYLELKAVEAEMSRKPGYFMRPCPKTKPNVCATVTNCADTKNWEAYGGISQIYHCGFSGFMERRMPSKENPAPANECFYDDMGQLVDLNHKYKGCRGTPDYFPFFQTGTDIDNAREQGHKYDDPGGPSGPGSNGQSIGSEAYEESKRYIKDKGFNLVAKPLKDLEKSIENIYKPS